MAATITNGFTNTGRIELRTLDAFYGNSLTITNGTLTNAPTGIIRAIACFGGKTLAAQLNNQGLLDVREALSLARASAAHVNSGTINLSTGNLSVSQSGTTPSFTNTGTILVPSGRTFLNTGGTLNLTTGYVGGQGGTLSTSGTTFNFTVPSMRAVATLSSTTVPGTLVIPANDTLRLINGSPTMTIENNGLLAVSGNLTLGGTLTSGLGSTVEVLATAATGGGASVTFTNAYTNNGTLRLVTADAFYGNSLTFTNGTFVNGSTGTVISTGLGSRTMSAPGGWTNNGTWNVNNSLNISSGAFAQNGQLSIASGATLTLAGTLTLNSGSATSVIGTLVKNGGCTPNGGGITGTGTGASCP